MIANATPLDKAAVTAYLDAHLAGFRGPIKVTKFATGQSNPTYRIDAASGVYVLRRQPDGALLKSAHAVDREFRVIKALQETGVPVPKALLLCDDPSVLGTMFYVMSFVDGRHFIAPHLPGATVRARAEIYDAMNLTLAALHRVTPSEVGLADFGKPGNYFERQVARWSRQYAAARTDVRPDVDRLIAWLKERTPIDDGRSSLVHGDFRIDNMIFAHDRAEVVALLDWELATLGHPFSDIAYQCMQWRLPADCALQGLSGFDREDNGIPSEDEYVARYCERSGFDIIPDWTFHLAFSFFRLIAILEGVLRRAADGNASNPALARQYGSMVPILAEHATQLIKRN